MLKQRLLTGIMAAALVLAIGYGIVRLVALRFEKGDVYPAYSTLRTDPLGTKAIYDSLAEIPGREVQRNFRPLRELRPAQPVTLVYAGVARRSQWGRDELAHFETLVGNGSRAVFAFAPSDVEPEKKKEDAAPEKPKSEEAPPSQPSIAPAQPTPPDTMPPAPDKPADKGAEDKAKKEGPSEDKKGDSKKEVSAPGATTIPFEDVAERWGFKFDVAQRKRAGGLHRSAVLAPQSPALEEELSWHSALEFTELNPAWRVLYRADEKAVLAERKWGDGTIVIASDAYLLSNEALRKEIAPEFLSWLIGSPQTIVFDEEHLGVTESTGIIALAKKYRLHGALVGAIIVALLWFWMESTPFLPGSLWKRNDADYVTGLDSQKGFVSLLRRAIKPSQVLEICVAEWRRTFSHDKRATAIVEAALESKAGKKTEAAGTYREIASALQRRTATFVPGGTTLPTTALSEPGPGADTPRNPNS